MRCVAPLQLRLKMIREETSSLSEDDDIDESVFDEPTQGNLEETLAGLYLNDSLWNKKKKYIETRPKNWLSRFTREYVPVAPPILPKLQSKEVTYQLVSLTEPEKPRIYKMEELQPFNDPSLQSNLCVVCWKLVIIGSSRIKCLHCPVVVHRYCVSNISDFFVPLKEAKGCQDNDLCQDNSLSSSSSSSKKKSSNILSNQSTNFPLSPPLIRVSQMDLANESQDVFQSPNDSYFPSLKTTAAFRRERTNKPKSRVPVVSPASAARRSHRDEHLPLISTSPLKAVVVDPKQDESTREVRWTCPFCIHEVNDSFLSRLNDNVR